jgi:CRP/FNR family transcriptional regulator, cyclic AMP receptor protein
MGGPWEVCAQPTEESGVRTPLAEIALFHNLPDRVLARIEANGLLRRYGAGELLWDGEPDHGIYVILDGQVEFVPAGNPAVACSCVGEFVAMDGARSSASVRAAAPTVALEIPRTEFRELIDNHPQLSLRLAINLVATVRRLNERLIELGNFDREVQRIHEELLLVTL